MGISATTLRGVALILEFDDCPIIAAVQPATAAKKRTLSAARRVDGARTDIALGTMLQRAMRQRNMCGTEQLTMPAWRTWRA
jgi:hypothetical protein